MSVSLHDVTETGLSSFAFLLLASSVFSHECYVHSSGSMELNQRLNIHLQSIAICLLFDVGNVSYMHLAFDNVRC